MQTKQAVLLIPSQQSIQDYIKPLKITIGYGLNQFL
jgi:hypothetical protein